MILIINIDNDTARGDMNRWRVSLSKFSYKSILVSIKNVYAIKRNILNIKSEMVPMTKDIRNAFLYENSFQVYLCLKKKSPTVEPSSGIR